MAEHELPLVQGLTNFDIDCGKKWQRDADQQVVNSLEARIKELEGMMLTEGMAGSLLGLIKQNRYFLVNDMGLRGAVIARLRQQEARLKAPADLEK